MRVCACLCESVFLCVFALASLPVHVFMYSVCMFSYVCVCACVCVFVCLCAECQTKACVNWKLRLLRPPSLPVPLPESLLPNQWKWRRPFFFFEKAVASTIIVVPFFEADCAPPAHPAPLKVGSERGPGFRNYFGSNFRGRLWPPRTEPQGKLVPKKATVFGTILVPIFGPFLIAAT